MMSPRTVWLDMAKGIGIVLVVVAHIADRSYRPSAPLIFNGLSLFYMPLFFAISGYLYVARDRQAFFWKKVRTLLVPYAMFMGAIIAAMYVMELMRGDFPAPWEIRQRITNALLGGRFLTGELGVSWFVTCLFFTQIVYNEVALRTRGATDPRMLAFVAVSVAVAYLIQVFWQEFRTPLAIAQVPLGIGAFWFGHFLRERGFAPVPSLWFAAVVLAAALVAGRHGADFTFTMKNGIYGPPLLGLLLALALSVCVFLAVRAVEDIRLLSSPLAAVGEASLVIMFLHQFFHFTLRDLGLLNEVALILLSTGTPYLVFLWLKGSTALGPWFLGRGELVLPRFARSAARR